MTDLSDRERHKRQRAQLWYRQEGKCYYCVAEMLLMWTIPTKFRPDNLCTVEHLRPKMHPAKNDGNPNKERRRVAACSKCNHKEGQKFESSLPIEKLWEASGGYPQWHPKRHDILAQRIEQRNSNPPVLGSNPRDVAK